MTKYLFSISTINLATMVAKFYLMIIFLATVVAKFYLMAKTAGINFAKKFFFLAKFLPAENFAAVRAKFYLMASAAGTNFAKTSTFLAKFVPAAHPAAEAGCDARNIINAEARGTVV